MRPIRRGASPINGDFHRYQDAKPELVSRLGPFCSYCERYVSTNLAIEHIQPKKGAYGQPSLEGRWENFLLACVNCNSIKGAKEVVFADLYFPDRDNTFFAFTYTSDGKVSGSSALTSTQKQIATDTLKLTGLDRRIANVLDENDKLVALDRVSQRMQAWGEAEVGKQLIDNNPTNTDLRQSVARTAFQTGYFSVWMTVFANDPDMRRRIIERFDDANTGQHPSIHATQASGCFDMATLLPVSPAPNPDNLADGGKI